MASVSHNLEGVVKEGDHSQPGVSQVIEIWKGRYKGEAVVLKVLKVSPQDPHLPAFKHVSVPRDPRWRVSCSCPDSWQRFDKEVISVRLDKHSSTVPLYGVSTAIAPFCLVYPWYKNGNIMDYLEKNPGVNRFDLVRTFQQTRCS